MSHGIEIVFENTEEVKKLLKDYKKYGRIYSNNIISIIFPFDTEGYYENFKNCIAILNFHNIRYLKIDF